MSLDQEEEIIQQYIQEIQDELSMPYIDQKKQDGFSEDLQQEIVEALDAIQNKEDQLKQLVELTGIILNKKQELEKDKQQELDSLEQTIYQLETDIEIHKQTSNSYQKLYNESQEQYMDLHNELIKCEEQLQDQTHQNLQKEVQKLKQNSQQAERNHEEQREVMIQLQEDVRQMQKMNQQLKDQNQKLRDEHKIQLLQNDKNQESFQKKIQDSQRQLKMKIEKLEMEKESNVNRYEDLLEFQRKEISLLEDQKKQAEYKILAVQDECDEIRGSQLKVEGQTLSQYRGDYQYNISQIEESEIGPIYNHSVLDSKVKHDLLENAFKKSDKPDKTENEDKNKDKNVQQEVQEKKLTPQQQMSTVIESRIRKPALKSNKQNKQKELKNYISQNKNGIKKTGIKSQKYKVPPPMKRDPYEQFFELVVQAIKLNSTHMDDILGIETKTWYKQAQGEGIPFHKWYGWVDQRLHSIRDELIKSREKSLLYSKRVIVF